ncbi:MAG: SRPBCC family protein [Rhizobiaceae bacterium]
MASIETTIDIDATPDRIWAALTDFAAYETWNPFIRRAKGEARRGARLDATMHLPGWKPMPLRPTILEAERNLALRWLGSLLFRGLFDGEHYFRIEHRDGGAASRLIHGERFSGILVPFVFGRSMRAATLQAFGMMNQALKARLEA